MTFYGDVISTTTYYNILNLIMLVNIQQQLNKHDLSLHVYQIHTMLFVNN